MHTETLQMLGNVSKVQKGGNSAWWSYFAFSFNFTESVSIKEAIKIKQEIVLKS